MHETYYYNYYNIPWCPSPETPETPHWKKAFLENTDSIKMENPNPESDTCKAMAKLEQVYYGVSVRNRAKYHTKEEAEDAIHKKYSELMFSPAGKIFNSVQIKAMCFNELQMTLFGCLGGADFQDPHLHKGVRGETTEERKTYNRSMVNRQIRQIFSANGIDSSLLKGKSLLFTIDPYSFRLTVKGAEDDGLKDQIEKVLNEGRNLMELFYHIMNSTPDIPKAVKTKYHLMSNYKDSTGEDVCGYDEDVFDKEFYEKYVRGLKNADAVTRRHAGAAGLYMQDLLNSLRGMDISSIPDMVLSIGYEDGELRDIPFAHHRIGSRLDLKA